MCGIIGYVGNQQAVPVVIEGLRRLEYRGYDSAGIAVINDGKIEVRRRPGKLHGLVKAIQDEPLEGKTALGHSRWATHGRPTEENAHPHRDCSGRIVVVHNGIIENYLELKRELQNQDHAFQTETDTEVVAHLIEKHRAGRRRACQVRRRTLPPARISLAVRPARGGRPNCEGYTRWWQCPPTNLTSSSPPGSARRSSSAWATANISWPRTFRRCCPTRATFSSWATTKSSR